jgi:hypothetical protein
MISEQEAEQLKKEMGGKICARCFMYGKDLNGIPTDKDEYVSNLVEVFDGVLWCNPHFQELNSEMIQFMGREK